MSRPRSIRARAWLEKADLFAPPEHSDVLAPLTRGLGPSYAVNAKPGVGLTSAHPWGYLRGGPVGAVGALNWRIQAWKAPRSPSVPRYGSRSFLFDDSEPDVRDGYAATAVAVDIVFTDGSRLSDAAAVDQYGSPRPQTQYGARLLSVDRWSSRTVSRLGGGYGTVERSSWSARSRSAPTTVLVNARSLDSSTASTSSRLLRHRPSRGVSARRAGTFSSDRFSRRQAAARGPARFAFGLPMTDGGNRGWSYSTMSEPGRHEPAAGSVDRHCERPPVPAGLRHTSHIPSPWMGTAAAGVPAPAGSTPNPDRHDARCRSP